MVTQVTRNSTAAAPSTAEVLSKLVRNGLWIRGVLLAVASAASLATGHPRWVPFEVSAYAIANAYALTVTSVKAARRG